MFIEINPAGREKKLIPFFLLLFLFVASCKDKAPTAPEESTSAEKY